MGTISEIILLLGFIWLCRASNSRKNVTEVVDFGRRKISEVSTLPTVRLAIYDNIRGYLNWLKPEFLQHARDNCPTVRCIVSHGAHTVKGADMVLFHAPTHFKQARRFPARSSLKPHTVFTLMSMEQPLYARMMQDTSDISKNFQLTATYLWSKTYPGTSPPVPNMPLTYFPLNFLSTDEILAEPLTYEQRDGFGTGVTVAAFVSNCGNAGAKQRAAYLQALMKVVRVHSYGACHNNRKEPDIPVDPKWPNQKRRRKVETLKHYKFYLAFENMPISDYVSEKVFEGLVAGSVPVYRGAPEIAKFMPASDSFIDANQMSAEDLGNLLQRLGDPSNRVEYDKYLQFKKRPVPDSFVQMASMSYCHKNVLCRLCDHALNASRTYRP